MKKLAHISRQIVEKCALACRVLAVGCKLPATGSSQGHAGRQAGFTILLAALVASLVLSLGISVFSIAQKQLILASTGRNSQYAFYSADTAAECALYWDVRHDFASTTNPISPITCDDDTEIDVAHTELTTYPVVFEYQFEPNGYCAQVTVIKRDVPLPGERWRTLVRANGFSVACSEIQTSARVLQRSVELSY